MNQPTLLFTRDRMADRVPALIQALSGRGWVKGRDLSRLLDCDDRTVRALAQVVRVGGHLVWLDCVWPQHRKAEWRTAGRITLVRSTNHRVRLVSIFERVQPC